jgi:RHS repeat-associated protein
MEITMKFYKQKAFLLLLLIFFGGEVFSQVVHDKVYIPIGHRGSEKNEGTLILGGTSFIIDGDGTNGGHVEVFSGTSIILKPGFHAKKGSSFHATVGDLSTPNLEPVPEYNWVVSRSYNGSDHKVGESIQFSDYLGRPIQSLSRNFTENKLIGAQTIYDKKGRAVLTTLPVPFSQSNLNYKNGLICNSMGENYSTDDFDTPSTLNRPKAVNSKIPNTLGWYYGNNNTQEKYVSATAYPYTRVEYSKTQPGKQRRVAGVGEAFRMGSGHEVMSFSMPAADNELSTLATLDTGIETRKLIKTVSQDAHGNHVVAYSSVDGKQIAACMSGIRDDGKNLTPVIANYSIPATVAYLDIHIPEGNSSIQLSTGNYDIVNLVNDQQIVSNQPISGRKSFSSSQLKQSRFYRIRSRSGAFTLSQSLNYYLFSFQVYDEMGRLRKSYSSKAVEDRNSSLASTFEYNSEGLLIKSTSNDQGTSEFKYRKDGMIRFSQNALQRTRGKMSYTNYDKIGRPIESGECSVSSFAGLNADNESFGGSDYQERSYMVYDQKDHKFYNQSGLSQSWQQNFVAGNVSKTYNDHSITWYSYTYDGNVEWVVQKFKDTGSVFTLNYEYDFNGNVVSVVYQKGKNNEFTHLYAYDKDLRLSEVRTKTRMESEPNLQAKYYYYLHGPLKRVELAENLQGIDYVYTLSGALKSINHPNLDEKDPGKDGYSNSFQRDVFALSLDYYSGDYQRNNTSISSRLGANYNGNIHAQRWKTRHVEGFSEGGAQNIYTYEYYKNNWLKGAQYGTYVCGNASASLTNHYQLSNLNYDANGNIRSLNRTAYGSNNKMDELTYHYNNGKPNQLNHVSDAHPVKNYNDLISQSVNNYHYDAIGQMTHSKEDGHYFEYDVTGKVTNVRDANNALLASYVYDERGFRIKKTDHRQNVTTYYVRDLSGNILAVYDQNHNLRELALYGSGRIGLAQIKGNSTNYVYELTDHLGNVRATVQKNSNSLTLTSQADYYPFGMIMPNKAKTPNEYRFGYQGQFAEKDEETGYNQFELRLWDSRIGRWLTTDPAGQFASPYLGMANNPIKSIDPDGAFIPWFENELTGAVARVGGVGKDFASKLGKDWNYLGPDNMFGNLDDALIRFLKMGSKTGMIDDKFVQLADGKISERFMKSFGFSKVVKFGVVKEDITQMYLYRVGPGDFKGNYTVIHPDSFRYISDNYTFSHYDGKHIPIVNSHVTTNLYYGELIYMPKRLEAHNTFLKIWSWLTCYTGGDVNSNIKPSIMSKYDYKNDPYDLFKK